MIGTNIVDWETKLGLRYWIVIVLVYIKKYNVCYGAWMYACDV